MDGDAKKQLKDQDEAQYVGASSASRKKQSLADKLRRDNQVDDVILRAPQQVNNSSENFSQDADEKPEPQRKT